LRAIWRDSHADSNRNSDPDVDSNANTYTDSQTYPSTKGSSDPGASPVAGWLAEVLYERPAKMRKRRANENNN